MSKATVLLCILDGVGIAPASPSNPLSVASTPTLNRLRKDYPHSQLRTDGAHVGLPDGQMGNSEVGHITIGSGRILKQSLVKITDDLAVGDFAKQAGFGAFVSKAKAGRAIHLIGLMSNGGIHSHSDHVLGLVKLLKDTGRPIFIHAITDGRDTHPNAGKEQVAAFEAKLDESSNAHVVSVVGRFYGMDRDNRWDRVQTAWGLFTQSTGPVYESTGAAFDAAYREDLSDEHIDASKIKCAAYSETETQIQDGDSVLLFNFRSDRARELTRCFLGMTGSDIISVAPKLTALATMTQYDSEFEGKVDVIYPPEFEENLLGETISNKGLKQLRIAETEKYAHVTFFFNNGRDDPYTHEDRILVPSPTHIETYDQAPEMALPEVTEKLVAAIISQDYDLIVLNIANGDMVGHTGELEAALKAVEHIDTALTKILSAIDNVNGHALIIADHGNIEEMSIHHEPSTQHSTNPVPCHYFGRKTLSLSDGGLSDVAPTLLELLGLEKPKEMTGRSLIET